MLFSDLAKMRFSARSYRPDPVEESKLMSILEAGRIAPSAANYQPWYFIVIRDEKNREKMTEAYTREWFRQAPVMIVICGNHSSSWKRSDGKDHCDIDIAIAADHMTLAAAELGLGTCWICNFNRNLVAQIINLPENIEPIVILSLGYTDAEPDMKRHELKRKPMETILFHESFNL